jgi:hypothetical protein
MFPFLGDLDHQNSEETTTNRMKNGRMCQDHRSRQGQRLSLEIEITIFLVIANRQIEAHFHNTNHNEAQLDAENATIRIKNIYKYN